MSMRNAFNHLGVTLGGIPLSGPVPGTPVVKERPILFADPLVRALLEGRKGATRRPVKPQPVGATHAAWVAASTEPGEAGKLAFHSGEWPDGPTVARVKCPFGKPGDRLWVRETCCIEHQVDGGGPVPPHSDGRPVRWQSDEVDGQTWEQAHYRATDPRPELVIATADGEECGCRWRPSIFMPRWASRITLEVTGVRVERLQDITEEQAEAEGVCPDFHTGVRQTGGAVDDHPTYREGFAVAWDAFYGTTDDLSWAADPWTWVVEFPRLTPSR